MGISGNSRKAVAVLLIFILIASLSTTLFAQEFFFSFIDNFDNYEAGIYSGDDGPGIWFQYPTDDAGNPAHGDAEFRIVSDGGSKYYKLKSNGATFVKSIISYNILGSYFGPSDYMVGASLKINAGEGGIIVRVDNALQRYYLATVYKSSNKVVLWYVDETQGPGGAENKLGEANLPAGVNPGDWFSMMVGAKGDNIWVTVKGETLINITDNRLPTGFAGVYTFLNREASFDGVWMFAIVESETTTTTVTSTETETETETTTVTTTTTTAGDTVTQTTTQTVTTAAGTVTSTATTTATTTVAGTTVTSVATTTTTSKITVTTTVTEAPAEPMGEFDFELLVSPTTLTLSPGQSGTAAVTLNLLSGESESIQLIAAGLPSDFSVSFAPPSVKPTGVSTLQVKAGSPGSYTLVVQAQGGGVVKSRSINVVVEEPNRCLIATAVFASEVEPLVQDLRGFRDGFVMETFAGKTFMDVFHGFYYSWSPYVADAERANPLLRSVVKVSLYPLLFSLDLSRRVSEPLGSSPEIAVLTAGILSSVMIGVAYVAPIATLTAYVARRRTGRWINPRTSHLLAALLAGVAFFALAELLASPMLMAASTVTIVMASLLLGASTPLTILTTQLPKQSIKLSRIAAPRKA